MDDEAKTETDQKKAYTEDVGYWLKWLKAAKKAAKTHWADAKAAWCEFDKGARDTEETGADETTDKCYPAYWARVKTIESAYYAREPKLVARREFDINDPLAADMSLYQERLGKYLIKNSNFSEIMRRSVGDFIHADKTTTQVVYEHREEKQQVRIPLQATQDEAGNMLFVDGETQSFYEGSVEQDAEGYFYVGETSAIAEQVIKPLPVAYDEIVHSPEAKHTGEVKAIGYKFCLTYDEAVTKFGKEAVTRSGIPWKASRDGKGEDSNYSQSIDLPGKYLEGWEIWCKESRKVYFVNDSFGADFLAPAIEDPYGLRGFFPSPPMIIGSPPRSSMYPTPSFIHCWPVLKQLHQQWAKVCGLIKAVRRRAIVDGSEPELVALANELGDREFIAVQNMKNLIEKGGIQNLIQFFPVAELVQAIGELTQLEDRFNASLDQWIGTPDIIRGISDPLETAEAQGIKYGAANDRFRFQKMQVQELARATIEMMTDLALRVFDDQKLARIVGYQYLSPEQQQRFSQALMALRSDEDRLIRIDIETDSTTFGDDAKEQMRRNSMSQTLINGLDKIAAIAQSAPPYVPIVARTLLSTLEGMQGGREFEDGIKSAVQQLMALTQQPPPEGPPPPDYEGMKLELKARELGMRERELEIKALAAQVKMMAEAKKGQQDEFALMLEQRNAQFNEMLQQNYLELERYKAQVDSYEKLLEERRLAAVEMQAAYKEPPAPAPLPPPQPITVVNSVEPQKPKRTLTRIIRDQMGNMIGSETEELPEIIQP